jgi:hypothetical protein
MKGFSGLPVDYQKAVKQMGDSLFLHTSSFFSFCRKKNNGICSGYNHSE